MAQSRAESVPKKRAIPLHDAHGAERATLGLIGAGLFALMTGLGALVAIPLPPFGVPQTLQTLAVVCAALCLGPKWAPISMVFYIGVGAIGAGVFAEGESGLARLMGQTGGYLFGFLLCQPVITSLIRKKDGSVRGWGAMVLAVLAGHMVIFAIGVPWLAVVRDISLMQATEGAFFPFIPGMIAKTVIAVLIGRAVAPWAMKRFW